MQSRAQTIVGRVSALRRTLDKTPQSDRVLAGLVVVDDLTGIVRASYERSAVFSSRRSLATRRERDPAQRGDIAGVDGDLALAGAQTPKIARTLVDAQQTLIFQEESGRVIACQNRSPPYFFNSWLDHL